MVAEVQRALLWHQLGLTAQISEPQVALQLLLGPRVSAADHAECPLSKPPCLLM